MKTKVLAITALFCSLHTICAYCGPNKNYNLLEKGTNETTIEVLGDCDVIVADIAPVGKEKIYGDRVGENAYGGTSESRFTTKQVTPNDGKKGIKVMRADNRVVLSINFAELKDTEIKIHSAEYRSNVDHPGYYPGNVFTININKGGTEGNIGAADAGIDASLPDGQTINNAYEIGELKNTVEVLRKEVSQLKETKNTIGEMYNIIPLLIALLVGLLIGYFLFMQNRKLLDDLSKECSDLKKVVDNWEKKNVPGGAHQTTEQKNKGKSSMTDDDIKRFIVEQIKSLQPQYESSTSQPAVATSPVPEVITQANKKKELATDTDNVKYHQEDNSFSLEQTDIKIWRIYSEKGEYYYTIVDDPSVREELSGMLLGFEGCITYQTTDGTAKRVEPVTDGKLRKDGNKFYVDANNKLVVKFA